MEVSEISKLSLSMFGSKSEELLLFNRLDLDELWRFNNTLRQITENVRTSRTELSISAVFVQKQNLSQYAWWSVGCENRTRLTCSTRSFVNRYNNFLKPCLLLLALYLGGSVVEACPQQIVEPDETATLSSEVSYVFNAHSLSCY